MCPHMPRADAVLALTQLLCSLDVFVIKEFTAVQLFIKHGDKERVSVRYICGH